MQQTEDFETEVSIELGDQDKPCVALNLQIRKGNVHQREDLAVEVISEFANKERPCDNFSPGNWVSLNATGQGDTITRQSGNITKEFKNT